MIVWGINYAPELTGIAPFNTGLCDYLRERGHDVEMVTTFPYYPFWKKLPGDEARLFRTDDIDGIKVHRCWHYVPRRVTTLRRIWHELSFGLSSLWRVLRRPAADVYLIVSPPLILGLLASFATWIKRRPFVFHVQDLQPDAAVGLGMVKPGLFTRLLYRIEAKAYRDATVVSGISEGMIAAFARKGVASTKRVLFPNWIRWYGRNAGVIQDDAERAEQGRKFREKFGIGSDVFLATYSGNLGKKQGMETLLDAAALLAAAPNSVGYLGLVNGDSGTPKNSGPANNQYASPNNQNQDSVQTREILILIVGDGVMREALERRIAEEKLTNVRIMKLLVETDYHGMLAASDLGLILQAPGTGQFFFPSKLLSTLSVGTPVVSVADADSQLAKAVAQGSFGVNVPTSRPAELARALEALQNEPLRLSAMRRNTKWVDRFAGELVLGNFEKKLLEVVEARRRF